MPEDGARRLSIGSFLAAAVENRLLQLLDPVEPSFRIGQQPVSAMQQALALAAGTAGPAYMTWRIMHFRYFVSGAAGRMG